MPDSIFEADELEAEATGPEAELPQPATTHPNEGQPRGEDGKFLPKQPAEGDGEGGDAQPPPAEDDGKGGTVPQGALHAERERRKAIEAELATAREALAKIQQFRDAAKAKQPEALPAADDPAAVEHLRQRLGQIESQQSQIIQQRQFDAADQAEIQQLQSVMATSEASFRAEKPDYDAAIMHVVQARAQELALYGLKPHEIQQAIAEEATDIARSAVSQGRNPAELGYQIALSRGYRPESAQAVPQQQGGAAATLAAIQAAQAASKSLGQGGGATPQAINAEAIRQMTDDEFDALYSTPEGKRLIDAL